MCGQSRIWACYLAMPRDGKYCPWFSWAFPLLDIHLHTKQNLKWPYNRILVRREWQGLI